MFLTKNWKEQVLDYMDSSGKTLASITWAVRTSYNSATDAIPAQVVFGRDMLFNLKALINWKELSIKKSKIVDKANLREN